MSEEQMQDISQTVLTSMTEEEFANWHRRQGTHVICHLGRYWKKTVFGFYEPLHWLARLSATQATCPTPLLWGFRASLCESDAASANGSMPIHLLLDLESYDMENFSKNRRWNLRKCRKLVKMVELTGSALLQQEGYEVVVSALTRAAYTQIPSQEDYLKKLKNYSIPGRLILAGLIGNKLGGYLTGYAVGKTAYMEDAMLATEALPTNLGSGLRYEFAQICRRTGKIREIVSGLHCPEDQALCVFKEGMGFPVKHIPAKVQINPIIGELLRKQYPHKYYRLTGHD